MERWAVVADDLTGAGDTGVQFVREGLKAKVCLTLEDVGNPLSQFQEVFVRGNQYAFHGVSPC